MQALAAAVKDKLEDFTSQVGGWAGGWAGG
jgi:hypothetical protein